MLLARALGWAEEHGVTRCKPCSTATASGFAILAGAWRLWKARVSERAMTCFRRSALRSRSWANASSRAFARARAAIPKRSNTGRL